MGETQYSKCKKMLTEFTGDQIAFDELIILIKMKIGNDKYRVVRPCFELMIETKLIEEKENGIFSILRG